MGHRASSHRFIALAWAALLAGLSGCGSAKTGYAPAAPAPDYASEGQVAMESEEAPAEAPMAEPAEPSEREEADSGGYGMADGKAAPARGPSFLPPPPPPPPPPRVAQAGGPAAGKEGGRPDTATGTPIEPGKPIEAAVDVPPVEPGADPTAPGATAQKVAGPLLIYNATLYLAVFEAVKAIDGVQKLATELGGYLVRRDERTITVRVPAKQYRTALEGIGKLGDVLHREETVQDVTDEFFDLQVRLKNAHAMRARLEQLLQQAKNVEEALMVERELGRVTEEIERFEGRLKLLRELIAFSTITVEFKPRPVDVVGATVRLPFDWLNQLGLSQLLSL